MIKRIKKKYQEMSIVAKASIWFVICSVIQKGISVITTPLYTRMMTTEQYGQFTVYSSWIELLTVFTTLRINWATFSKGMSKYKDDRDAYTSSMQTLTLLITGVVFAIYIPIRKYINSFIELPSLIIISMFVQLAFTPATDFWSLRNKYEYRYKKVVALTLLLAFFNAAVGVIAVYFSTEKGYAKILAHVVVLVIFGVICFVINLKKGKCLAKVEYWNFAITFALPLLLHYLSQYILDQSDKLMIQKMVGFSEAAVYGVGYTVALLMNIITQSLNQAFVPYQYEKLENNDFEDVDENIFKMLMLVGACTLLLIAFAPEIMNILADQKYTQAIYVIPPVALGVYFTFMYVTFANMEFYYSLTKFTMIISIACAGMNIILNYICINAFGYIAAAYTTLACYIVFSVSHYCYMTHELKKLVHKKKILNATRISLFSCGLLFIGLFMNFTYRKWYIRYFIIGVLFVVLFLKRNDIKTIIKLKKSDN